MIILLVVAGHETTVNLGWEWRTGAAAVLRAARAPA
jgi:hypothetical protein